MVLRSLIARLLGHRNNFEKRDAQQCNPEKVEDIAQWGRVSWVACDDGATGCEVGGWHQSALLWVVDPLANTDKHQAKAEQQSVGIGNALDVYHQTDHGPRCTKCHKQVVPVFDLQPGVSFIKHEIPFPNKPRS